MLLQPEDRGTGLRFVATDAFENAEAILQCIAHEMDMRVVPIDDRAVHPNFVGFFHPLARSPIGRFPSHHCLAANRDIRSQHRLSPPGWMHCVVVDAAWIELGSELINFSAL